MWILSIYVANGMELILKWLLVYTLVGYLSGITIYAVGFGGANESFLSQIASEKGARKIDLSKLSSTFKEIASSIATEIS